MGSKTQRKNKGKFKEVMRTNYKGKKKKSPP
jgi:hypothetical protein